MFFRYRRIFQAGIGVLDLCVVALMLILPSALGTVWSLADLQDVREDADFWTLGGPVLFALTLWFFLAARLDLYKSRRTESLVSEIVLLGEAWILVVALTHAFASVAVGNSPICVTQSLVYGFLTLSLIRVSIRLVLSQLRERGRNTRSLLFVGWSPVANRLYESIKLRPAYGLRCRGVVKLAGEEVPDNQPLRDLGVIDDLERVLAEWRPQRVVLSPPPEATMSDIVRAFRVCDEAGLPCTYAADFELANLRPVPSEFAGVPIVSFNPQQFVGTTANGKRIFDLVTSGLALLFLLPLFLTIALIVKLQDGGPVFFRQRRVGRFGVEFWCLKFRTMVPNAEKLKAQLESQNEESGPAFKMKNDPRITRMGRFLRKFSIDELPQLWNVFIGDMSLVGPRPPTPDEVRQYKWTWRRRLSVRPGLTCIWQIWGRNRVEFDEWMEMDLLYIDNWSIWKDIKLILRTVLVVARGTGS